MFLFNIIAYRFRKSLINFNCAELDGVGLNPEFTAFRISIFSTSGISNKSTTARTGGLKSLSN